MSNQPLLDTLLPEILGFHPQLLLDDIINAANEPIYQCTEFVSNFMIAWAEERAKRTNRKEQDEVSNEIENGLVQFQTLLEYHVDLAFDYYEVWTLRNIFYIPPNLSVVAPHHKGLNLHHDSKKEADLFSELEELRNNLRMKRRLNRTLKAALPVARSQLAHSRSRFESISFIPSRPVSPTAFETLAELADSLPEPTLPDSSSFIPSIQLHDPAKRPWEQGRVGYDHWAVAKLVERTKGDEPGDQDPQVADAQRGTFGDAEEIWGLHGAVEAEKVPRPREMDSVDYQTDSDPGRSKKRKVG
ncbi:hypothetical protein M422DRAFT_232063 [Sphaerobolus stellatus SS14]|uniref:Uncharacterized protein n=1 Tax=Sphaerobolus stellatus (strain SS14) TaxID=990650 RepID=A0A0C9V664_SPHS4|nr:hypothetical protein M422DRAFT_232063 [Sphaerobolus stellatus SS14]